MYFSRPMLLRIVARLVSVPPSQRLIHVKLAASHCSFFYCFLRLLLATDE